MQRVLKGAAIGLAVAGAATFAGASRDVADTAVAASSKVKLTVHCGLAAGSASALTGSYTGGAFGKGKITGVLTAPNATITFKNSKGTATAYASGKLAGKGRFTGTWHWTGGTRAYKKIKGKGRIEGTVDCQPWTLTGTASY